MTHFITAARATDFIVLFNFCTSTGASLRWTDHRSCLLLVCRLNCYSHSSRLSYICTVTITKSHKNRGAHTVHMHTHTVHMHTHTVHMHTHTVHMHTHTVHSAHMHTHSTQYTHTHSTQYTHTVHTHSAHTQYTHTVHTHTHSAQC